MTHNNHLGPMLKLLNKEFEHLHTEKAKSMGLTPAQLFVLHYIAKHQGERICNRDIEKQFELTHATVSGIISRLEAKGFIDCNEDNNDRRFKMISITEKAMACEDEMKRHIDHYEKQLVNGFSETEKEQLVSYIKRLLGNVGANLPMCNKEEGK